MKHKVLLQNGDIVEMTFFDLAQAYDLYRFLCLKDTIKDNLDYYDLGLDVSDDDVDKITRLSLELYDDYEFGEYEDMAIERAIRRYFHLD